MVHSEILPALERLGRAAPLRPFLSLRGALFLMLKKCWDHLEETILIYSYLLVIPLLFAQVICRYVLNHSLSWSEEIARYLFIWQVWLGSSYCVQKGRHIRIDVFTSRLSPRFRQVYEILIALVCIVFCAFLACKSIAVTGMIVRLKQTSPAVRIPMQFIYACVPVSCVLMILRYFEQIFHLLRGGSAADLDEEA